MKYLTPSLLLVLCFVFGGAIFKWSAPRSCADILKDDSIFVLTGDARRIPYAMKKLHEHPDADLYIIGAGAVISDTIAQRATIESESKSTYQNAIAIKNIATRTGLDRLVLVTTEDHINRALYLVRHELPDTEIVACPVRLTGMSAGKRLERWAVEYVKYIVTLLGIKES